MNVENLPITPFIFTAFKKIEKEKQPYLKLGPYAEISLKIFKKLEKQDLCKARLVCKEWEELIEQTEEWKSFHAKKVRTNSPTEKQQANFLAPTQWDKHRIAECLWQDSSAIISESMIAKVNTAANYLSKEEFELKGVPSDGNCFFSAFLGSYACLSRKIPLLDDQENKISYLRKVLSSIIRHTNSERAEEIIGKGTWVSGLGEGDLLASALSIPIRLVTVNEEHLICGVNDMLILPRQGIAADETAQEWGTIPDEERPKEYILIVDLGGHFIYAQKPSKPDHFLLVESATSSTLLSDEKPSFSLHIEARMNKVKRFSLTEQDFNEAGKQEVFDPSNPLSTLPLRIFQRIFLSFNSLNDDELRKVLNAKSCARVFKQHLPSKVQLLIRYQPQKLPEYLDRIAEYLDKIVYSIEESNNFLIKFKLEEAEEAYTLALKLAVQENDPIQESVYMEKLGDVYVCKGTPETLLQAAGLYNYALRLAPPQRRKILRNRLSHVQNLLVKQCKGQPFSSAIIEKQFERNRNNLKKLREEIEEKIQTLPETPSSQEVSELYGEIAHQIKIFFGQLTIQALHQLDTAPCEYAMIGFGSLAREEMTPYSDLEFGILIQEDNPINKKYFSNLTNLLHLKVINLGETILPALNIPCLKTIDFFDGITPRGFAFDGAGVEGKGCKTPFGNGKTFELIQTPEKMAQYIAKDEEGQWWHDKEPHLPMELLTFTHLTGNPELTRQYRQKLQKKLDIFCQADLSLREYLAKQHLVVADMEAFNPGMSDLSRQGMIFKVKNDFYRFPHLALDRLALLKKVMASDTFTRIDQLNKLGIITAGAANKLKEWMSIALFMRLKTYSHYQAQQEMMNPLIKPFGFDEPGLIKKQFALDQEALGKIKKICQIFIPFYQAMQDFLAGNEETLQSSELNDDSCQTQGDIALRLCQIDEAKKWYRLAKKADLKNSKIFNTLGIIYASKGNLNKAAKYTQQALAIDQNPDNKINPNIAIYYNNLGQIYREQGNLAKAIEHYQKALDIKRKLLGENHPSIANSYNNLGAIYEEQGNLTKALKYSQKALDIKKKLFIENRPDMATIYNNLGAIYQRQGNLAKAAKYIKKAGVIATELFGDNHHNIAIHHNNLGLFYREQGNLIKASEHILKTLAIFGKLYGENHPMASTAYHNLGQIYKEQGNLTQAVEYTKKALAICLKLFGENHHDVATSYNSLGQIYRNHGNLGQAAEYTSKALAIFLKLFSENHPDVATSYNNLGLIYQDHGNLGQAAEYTKKAGAIFLKLFGENHPAVATSCNSLGLIYQKQGNLEKAVEYTKKALAICLKLFGENHYEVATSYNNLGQIYKEQGNLEQAVEYTRKALAICLKLFGENHPAVATSCNNLGHIYQEQSNLEQAAEYIKKAGAIFLKLFGENHPAVATSCNNLGQIYQDYGNLGQAAEYTNKALAIYRKLFGENHPDVAMSCNNLGRIYQEQGNLGKAAEYAEKALAINLKLFGENHPAVAISCDNLGQIYQEQGNLDKAVEYTEKALAINLKLFGENHPAVAISCNNIGRIYQEQGNLGKAVEYVEKALAINLKLFGENHFKTAMAYNNLGDIYHKQGNLGKATDYAKKALAINLKLFVENHSKVTIFL
ncbi:tetratricopeptide repeat protein [Neochlamydia sp. AcF95]|uniref:tetratricopeptide repeat protein n=1 Tax=Neochlamydia sp. AcF95 TaxID=2795734 RepID=UPI001BC93239|nr:tetratricopeptide repeat protein [Neochlamydia sp. AcF95]MBS4169972.1 Uncharacterized protein [Neochlamydia sp. AcF95]